MKLTKRLECIASLIEENTNVIDVGCDHALLDIYLTLNNKNKCIASDINENSLQSAIKNIKKYNLSDKIEVVISDGLSGIDILNNNTIVISGMGTSTILNIIKNSDVNKINNLIIQSNNDLSKLRKEIIKYGFYIDDELVVKDKNIYYVIIKFKKGFKKINKKDYYYGPILKTKNYSDFIEYLIDKNNKIINSLPKKKIIYKIKFLKINKYLKKINKKNY